MNLRAKRKLWLVMGLVEVSLLLLVSSAEAKEPAPLTSLMSRAAKVAILDSGSNLKFKEGISLIDGSVKDRNGHGTLMARQVLEVYPEAELYIVKVMNEDGLAINEEAVILGLEWAISKNVDVVNMSLSLKDSEKLHQAIKKAYKKGIVIVAAAGNIEMNVSSYQSKCIKETMVCENVPHDAIRTTQYEIVYPAKYEEVISVGALDRYGKAYPESAEGEIFCKGYYSRHAGTSVASAYAAGLAAKVILKNPDLDLKETRRILKQSIKTEERK